MNPDTKNWAELGNQVGKKDQHLNKNENKGGGEGKGELRRPCWRENAERLVLALLVLHLFKVSPLLPFILITL
jgi:hypothetical protein